MRSLERNNKAIYIALEIDSQSGRCSSDDSGCCALDSRQ